MPQLQPGQVTPGANGAPALYGNNQIIDNVPFQERLLRLFKPQEFVTIRNVTEDPLYWQYMPEENEEISETEDGMQRHVSRKEPIMWYIAPGEVEVLVGASAYRALDVMYKNAAAAKTFKMYRDPLSPQFDEKGQHQPKNFNFSDGSFQESFIEQAYLGKAIPTFAGYTPGEQPAVPAAPVTPTIAAPVAPAMPVMTAPAPGPIAPAPVNTAETVGPVEDPTIPKPRNTEVAPLAPVSYAAPDFPVVDTIKEPANATATE